MNNRANSIRAMRLMDSIAGDDEGLQEKRQKEAFEAWFDNPLHALVLQKIGVTEEDQPILKALFFDGFRCGFGIGVAEGIMSIYKMVMKKEEPASPEGEVVREESPAKGDPS